MTMSSPSCSLYRRLHPTERRTLVSNAGQLFSIIDVAHVIPRSHSPKLKDNPLNLVFLNRYSHSHIDAIRSPIDGTNISREEWTTWWIRIVGKYIWEHLNNLKNN